MPSKAADAVWAKLRRRCELGLELDEGKFDLEQNIAQRSCLGTAVGSEARAISLVLVGMESQARDYFRAIRELALAAVQNNERYVYEDLDGRNLFGKYMAMRVAALAEWLLDGPKRSQYLTTMLSFLDQALEEAPSAPEDRLLDIEVLGPYVMHLGQLGMWERLLAVVFRHLPRRHARGPWWSLTRALQSLAGEDFGKQPVLANCARHALNGCFLSLTDVRRLNSPYDTRLTANDIASIAEIRARWLYGVVDPWVTVKSIRWPDLVEQHSSAQ
jgi:hypothetical protein